MRLGISLALTRAISRRAEAAPPPAPVLPENTVAPAVTGTPQEGQTLTVSNGTWTNADSFAYQWTAGGVEITGANSSTYALTSAEVGKLVDCDVTASNADGSTTATSNAVGPVEAAPVEPTLWSPADEPSLLSWFDLSDPNSYDDTAHTWDARFGTMQFQPNDVGAVKTATGFGGAANALVFDGTVNCGLYIDNPGFTECVVVLALNVTEANAGVNPLVWNRGFLGLNTAGFMIIENYGMQAAYAEGTKAEDWAFTLPGEHLLVTRHAVAARSLRDNGALVNESLTAAAGTEPAATESFELLRYLDAPTDYTIEVAAVGLFAASGWSTELAQKIEGFIAHNNLGHTPAILPAEHPYKASAPE